MGRTDFIKKIVDAFQIDVNLEKTPYAVGSTFLPVIPIILTPKIVIFSPTESDWANGIVVPIGKKWKIKIISFRWTSDVNAGNRNITLDIFERNNNTLYKFSCAAQAASLTRFYSFSEVGAIEQDSSLLGRVLPIPRDFVLHQGDAMFIFDDADIASGDTLTLSTLIVEEEDSTLDELEFR